MVRVYEDYVDVKDVRTNQLKANLKVAVYLEDNGSFKGGMGKPSNSLSQARDMNRMGPAIGNMSRASSHQIVTSDQQGDYQAVWQLEMWKRAEEAKFKAYLK
jgi:hypothetical protein